MIKVGYLIRLGNDPYEDIRHAAQDMGFDCGQISVWNMSMHTEEWAKVILKACKDFNFTVTDVWCGWSGPEEWTYPNMYTSIGLVPVAWRAQRVNEILEGAEFADMLGVKNIITHIGYLPDNPYDKNRIETVQATRYICKEIAKRGQRFLFETGEMIPNTLIQFMIEVGEKNVGVNFDSANMVINGRANSVDALNILAPFVYGMHAKDAVFPCGTNPKGREVPIAEGVANFRALIRILKDSGYDGSITIENEMTDSVDRDKEVTDAKAYLENIISALEN